MKSQTQKTMLSFLLIGLLFCSLTFSSISASPESGLEVLKEGKKYKFKRKQSRTRTIKNYKTGEKFESEYSAELTETKKIEEVDEDKGYLTVLTVSSWYQDRDNVTENSTMGFYADADNDDGDDIPEDIYIGFYSRSIIAGTWDKFTEEFSDFKDKLGNISETFDDFEYSLNKDDGNQKIEFTLDYKEEVIWHEHYNRTMKIHEESTLNYGDFVLKKYTSKQSSEVVDIENEDYLEENEELLTTKSEYEVTITRLGFFQKETVGMPNWVWISIGVGVVVAIVGIIYWKKKK